MNVEFVYSVIGPDRAGFVNELAKTTHELGGKWLGSKISRLEGRMAGIIKIEVPENNMDALKKALSYIDDEHKVDFAESGLVQNVPTKELQVNIDARDRPGIVNDISHLLVNLGVNIENMECHRLGVDGLGDSVFVAKMKLKVPEDLESDILVTELEDLEGNLVVEI